MTELTLNQKLGVRDTRAPGTAGPVVHTEVRRGPGGAEYLKDQAAAYRRQGRSTKTFVRTLKVDGVEMEVVVLVVREWAAKPKAKKVPVMWNGRHVPFPFQWAIPLATCHREADLKARESAPDGAPGWRCECNACEALRGWEAAVVG